MNARNFTGRGSVQSQKALLAFGLKKKKGELEGKELILIPGERYFGEKMLFHLEF